VCVRGSSARRVRSGTGVTARGTSPGSTTRSTVFHARHRWMSCPAGPRLARPRQPRLARTATALPIKGAGAGARARDGESVVHGHGACNVIRAHGRAHAPRLLPGDRHRARADVGPRCVRCRRRPRRSSAHDTHVSSCQPLPPFVVARRAYCADLRAATCSVCRHEFGHGPALSGQRPGGHAGVQ
jgi:hypothetical protein